VNPLSYIVDAVRSLLITGDLLSAVALAITIIVVYGRIERVAMMREYVSTQL